MKVNNASLTRRFIKHIHVFGLWYALIELLVVIDRKISLIIGKQFSHRLLHCKERYIMNWARGFFSTEIHDYNKMTAAEPMSDTSADEVPIWICWLQGESMEPPMVESLLNRVKRRAGNHPVHFISMENYSQYVDLPSEFVRMYDEGNMPVQQFADTMRAGLIAQKGGLWIDASIYLVRSIPDEVFTKPIFNVKGIKPNPIRDAVACDSTMWEAYFIASQPGSVTYSFIFSCFLKYWRHYDTLIDYFLFSYLAKLAREDLSGGREEYAAIPDNNIMCEQLSERLLKGESASQSEVQAILEGDTYIYKLSWKTKYPNMTADNRLTLASQLLNME